MSHCTVMPSNTGDTPMLNNSSSDSSSDTSVIIISGAVGGLMLLLITTIWIVLCALGPCVGRSHRKKEIHVYDQVLYGRTKLNTNVVNTVETFHGVRDSNIIRLSSHSTIYEEEHNYDYASAQEVIEMDTNPSCGVRTVENRAPVCNGIVMNSNIQNHQSSDLSHDHYHYNNATQLRHNTSATGDVEDEISVNTAVDGSLASEAEYGVINQPRCNDYDYDDTGDRDRDAKNVQLFKIALVARPNGEYEYGVINQPRCYDPIIVDQGHTPTTYTLPFITNSTDEDKYGAINQPQSDDSTINTTHGTTVD